MNTTNMMVTRYQPEEIERKWYSRWEEKQYFKPHGNDGTCYAIMMPPPNVTGTLHMGHAFQDTIMDILIRYHRMNGKRTLWQPGSDHAGIATQMVVERQLNAAQKTRHSLGREAFVQRIWQWKEESGGNIMQQLRRLGASADWSRERFSMDAHMSRAVRTLFVQWYDEGLIYRGKRLVNWDPILKTAISDIEVVNEEEKGFMYYIRYPFVAGQALDGKYLTIATTRPETIFADSALAVSPDDERYKAYIGKKVRVPLTDRIIPVIEDCYVEAEFGTGCVKITPAHDFNDYAVGQRHSIEVINIFNEDATLNDNAPPAYRGMDRFVARKAVEKALDASGLLEKVVQHVMMLPRGDRTGAVLEPYLTDQWFVDLTRKTQEDGRVGGYIRITQPAIEAVRSGAVRFFPKNWETTYFNWMENIQDWCISRQLWWGHQIPAWYDTEGNIYVAQNEAQVRSKYGLSNAVILRQDDDVLDTWFSSGLWPFSTQGWPDNTADLRDFYPSSVLVTGFDIIFFWVARMVMMGLYCMEGKVPFKDVYIHGLVRDGEGQKMSKSKGNVIDPIDVIDGISLEALIEKRTSNMMQPQLAKRIAAQTCTEFPKGIPACGTDALRLTFATQATLGRDIVFDIQRVEGYRNFCNKLWNAARFVLMQTQESEITQPVQLTDAVDCWIYAQLNRTIELVRTAIENYRFDFAAQHIYDFVWNQYCDWYLELAKVELSKKDTDTHSKPHTRWVLLDVLEKILRLAHPIIPFITEEIWQRISPRLDIVGESIMLQPFPVVTIESDIEATQQIEWVKALVIGVRKIRAEMTISPGKRLSLILQSPSKEDKAILSAQRARILALARLDNISVLEGESVAEAASFVMGNMTVFIPLAGIIDKADELARLDKEIEKLTQNISKLTDQLANVQFVSKAPTALVEKTRAQLTQDHDALTALKEQYIRIRSMN